MPRSKRVGAILSEVDFGFSAEELDADINAIKLARIKAAVDLKLGENGIHVLKQFSHKFLQPKNNNWGTHQTKEINYYGI